MIRPALQNDGGDITLVEIKDNSIYVQLRGACGTCPSFYSNDAVWCKKSTK